MNLRNLTDVELVALVRGKDNGTVTSAQLIDELAWRLERQVTGDETRSDVWEQGARQTATLPHD